MALRVWLPFNGNSKNQGLSDNNTTLYNTIAYSAGKLGQCIDFSNNASVASGSESLVTVPGLQLKNFTICAWIKVTSSATDDRIVAREGRGYNADGWSIKIDKNTNKISMGAENSYNLFSDTGVLNSWYHVALVHDDETPKNYWYLNGNFVFSVGGSRMTYNTTTGEGDSIVIGARTKSGSYHWPFDGCINDFRIYDECLSQKQIKEISKGLVAHYKLDNLYIETTENLVPANIYNYTSVPGAFYSGVRNIVQFQGETCFSVTTVVNDYTDGFICQQTTACTEGEVYTYSGYIWIPQGYSWSVGMRMITGGGGYFHQTIVGSGQWQYFSQTFTANNNTSGMIQGYEAQKYDTAHTIYLKKLQLEKRGFPTAFVAGVREGQKYEKDTSGHNYDGTITGTLNYNQDSARYSGSTKFGGTCADYIYRPIFDFLKSPFTFNCWAYQTSATSPSSGNTGNTLQMIAGQGRDCGLAGFELCSVNGYARLYLGTQTNGTYYTINDNTVNLLNNWHMITGTFDGAVAKLYVDGVLKGTKESAIEPSWGQATGFVIGKMSYYYSNQSTAYFPFAGSISDVRVYATALSADDILTIYKTSGIIDNEGNVYAYEFKEE